MMKKNLNSETLATCGKQIDIFQMGNLLEYLTKSSVLCIELRKKA